MIVKFSRWHDALVAYGVFKYITKQAGAELCQAQF